MNVLKQKQNSPRTLTQQVFMLVIATTDKFENLDPFTIGDRMEDIVKDAMSKLPDIVMKIENEGVISDEDKKRIAEAAVSQDV